jgi:hypothetical protein
MPNLEKTYHTLIISFVSTLSLGTLFRGHHPENFLAVTPLTE